MPTLHVDSVRPYLPRQCSTHGLAFSTGLRQRFCTFGAKLFGSAKSVLLSLQHPNNHPQKVLWMVVRIPAIIATHFSGARFCSAIAHLQRIVCGCLPDRTGKTRAHGSTSPFLGDLIRAIQLMLMKYKIQN